MIRQFIGGALVASSSRAFGAIHKSLAALLGQPTSLETTNTLAAYFLNYDKANRVTDFSSYRDAFETTYAYDNVNQLTASRGCTGTRNLDGWADVTR